jgi:hypothetical protein
MQQLGTLVAGRALDRERSPRSSGTGEGSDDMADPDYAFSRGQVGVCPPGRDPRVLRAGGLSHRHACRATARLAALLGLFSWVFERSGAWPGIGAELYSRMRDAGLQPDPRPLAEIVLHPDRDTVIYRRWAIFAYSLLPKIVEYGLGTEEQVRHSVEHDLHEELLAATGLVPLSWLMVGQWAHVPAR